MSETGCPLGHHSSTTVNNVVENGGIGGKLWKSNLLLPTFITGRLLRPRSSALLWAVRASRLNIVIVILKVLLFLFRPYPR